MIIDLRGIYVIFECNNSWLVVHGWLVRELVRLINCNFFHIYQPSVKEVARDNKYGGYTGCFDCDLFDFIQFNDAASSENQPTVTIVS